MQNSFDAVVIGAGPAGCSAALTLHMRGKSVAVVSNDPKNSPLARAERVSNYPGTGVISGAGLVSNMLLHLAALDIPLLIGRVISALPVGKGFGVSYGAEYLSCAALVICSGAAQKSFLPGERELLGRGVSYCATCDGMLYRQRRVVVLGFSEDSAEETNFLRGIGCDVAYFDRQSAKQYEIAGVSRVEALIADGISHPCDGVFILRDTVAADFFGKSRLGHLDPVLDEHRGDVRIGSDFKRHGNLHRAVAGALRRHVDHVVDAVDLLLQGNGDGRGDVFGTGAGILGGNRNGRRRDVGKLFNRELRRRNRSEERNHETDDAGENRTVNEKMGKHVGKESGDTVIFQCNNILWSAATRYCPPRPL